MSGALLFPGQGAQYPGMLHAFPDHPEVERTLAEAQLALGQDVLALDSASALESTVAVQLALCIAGVTVARALLAEDAKPAMVAGFSVGAFAAAMTAGVLDFASGLALVRLRGTLMEKAYPRGYGMGVILGLSEHQVQCILNDINMPATPVFIANLNAPHQIAIAGSEQALTVALERAYQAGAHKAERLAMSVPSHCPLLASVAEQLAHAISQVPLSAPHISYVSNRGARVLQSAQAIGQDLAMNVMYPVRWHDMTTALYERGVRLFVELPPGQTLTNLTRAAFPDVRTLALGDSQLHTAVALMQRKEESKE